MTNPDFSTMVPGFDFLQNLLKGAGSSMPAMSQWIAPTLDAGEVDKRIQELRTVQFWLEQNARMLGATIQALEVQRMTLATLQTMNLPMSEIREKIKLDPKAFETAASAASAAEPPPPPRAKPAARKAAAAPSAAAPAPGVVDPMQWWGALTRQFADLAAQAVKDSQAAAAAQVPAAAQAAAGSPAATPEPATKTARRGAAKAAR